MKLSIFNYHLPKKLIAQKPQRPRDHSRLLVLDKKTGKIQHKHFYNIVNFLKKGDVLVLNNTKVFPARLHAKKKETGGKIEVFLLKQNKDKWECLLGGKIRREGMELEFKNGLKAKVIKKQPDRTWVLKFNFTGKKFDTILQKIGETPVPPYVKEKSNLRDYQTVYAKHSGSVAAPTAGFHFTKPLINKLKKKGVQFEYVTLHVGLGTFEPVRVKDITKHQMHAEFASIDKKTAQRINKAKKENRRIIAVGTTTVRVLENFVKNNGQLSTVNCQRSINSFIYPGYKFKTVDAMITNFHLPKSTLLMLVSAFAGRGKILKAYRKAVKKKYRFYSFGDGMFIQ